MARFIGTQAGIKRRPTDSHFRMCLERQLAQSVAGEIRLRLAFCEKAIELSCLAHCTPVAHTERYLFGIIDSKRRAIRILYGLKCSAVRRSSSIVTLANEDVEPKFASIVIPFSMRFIVCPIIYDSVSPIPNCRQIN